MPSILNAPKPMEGRETILRLDNDGQLFIFHREMRNGGLRWGILTRTGRVLYPANFVTGFRSGDWDEYNVVADQIEDGVRYHYHIISYWGEREKSLWSTRPYLKPRSGYSRAKNAFIFFEREPTLLKRGVAQLVVCHLDEEEGVLTYTKEFKFGRSATDRDINDLALSVAQRKFRQKMIEYEW